jgi:hypothetical protein
MEVRVGRVGGDQRPGGPGLLAVSSRVIGFQIRMAASSPAEATSVRPLTSAIATDQTSPGWPVNGGPSGRRRARSQTWTAPLSSLETVIVRPPPAAVIAIAVTSLRLPQPWNACAAASTLVQGRSLLVGRPRNGSARRLRRERSAVVERLPEAPSNRPACHTRSAARSKVRAGAGVSGRRAGSRVTVGTNGPAWRSWISSWNRFERWRDGR